MIKKERKRYFELGLLVSMVIFLTQFITTLLAGSVIYLFHITDIISLKDIKPEPVYLVLYMIVVSTVIGFIVALTSMRIPTNPLVFVIQKINQLASGNFKVRLSFKSPLSRHPVLSELSESFNRMAEELENTEMLRGDFVNNFSHEFKTPIVSIAGFASVLRQGDLTEEEREQYLAVIEEEARRLSDMATNVLNLTKVENQSILTDISSFNLSEQIRSCILLLTDKWENKNLKFRIDFREYNINANEELLKQVWINLIDNAIKFSSPEGTIEINIWNSSDKLTVTVLNSGEEIPKEELSQVFNKFYQADKAHSVQGNGIGLAIVKQVVALHKGTVSVRSEDGLTMFTVKLPTRQ